MSSEGWMIPGSMVGPICVGFSSKVFHVMVMSCPLDPLCNFQLSIFWFCINHLISEQNSDYVDVVCSIYETGFPLLFFRSVFLINPSSGGCAAAYLDISTLDKVRVFWIRMKNEMLLLFIRNGRDVE
jgi:hypothetical protein